MREPYVDLLPGRDRRTLLANSLRLMRAGLSKPEATFQALIAAAHRPPSTTSPPTPKASPEPPPT